MTAVTVREATAGDQTRWDDLVRSFPNHHVCQTRAWVESLAASRCGRPLYLLFERDGDVVGCLPGLLSAVGPVRLFGSPRAGWQTMNMGPAFDPARLPTHALLEGLVPYLEREHHVAHIELMHTALDAEAMRAHGFVGEPAPTLRGRLYPADEKRTLKAFKNSARRNVLRAQRLGLTVRFEHDDRFIDEHYDQLREVYQRGGHTIPFTRRRIAEVVRHMVAAGKLFGVSVYLPGGRVNIATGTFLIEGRELSLWMWAHRTHYRWYRPTELLTWSAMQRAVAAGCDAFDLCGRGDFKVGSSRVDLQACKLEYSIVSPK